jgi:hypothetical protein
MKDKTQENKQGLDGLREQIMTFACGAHAFGVELDEFDSAKQWNGIFVVNFRGSDREERLFCQAKEDEQHIRFWVEVAFDSDIWKDRLEDFLTIASKFDIAIGPRTSSNDGKVRLVRLSIRAWIPRFSQRIFGLTFSNLMECKAALDQLNPST